ncbi:MAG: CxxxxCH/CxxCH domain c-type cytochrome, partial [Planctomycetota bacterium]
PGLVSNPVNYSTWGSPASVGCDECHYHSGTPDSFYNQQSGNPLGGSHDAHFAATNWSASCSDCHAVPANLFTHSISADAASEGAMLLDRANALQDEATITAAALGSQLATDPGNESCDNAACHNPSDDGHVSNPWGTANTGCEMCHEYSTSLPTGSHSIHLDTRGYACTACHDDNTLVPDHLNFNVNIDTGFAYTGTTDDYPGSWGSCSAGGCHPGDIVWGSSPTNCDQCHVSDTDVNDFVGNNQQASFIDTGEFDAVGHGQPSGPNLGCLDCHDLLAPHDDSANLDSLANPFRLNAGFTCTDNAANCHDGNPTPSVATVVTHSSTAMSTAGYTPQVDSWSFDPKCVDCHDPHGDGSNLKMIQVDLWDSGSTGARVPSAAPENSSLAFIDTLTGANTAGDTYADLNDPWSSLCQECHETADPDMTSFKDNAVASTTGHPTPGGNPGDCSNCHQHDTAFRPSGCSGCHGADNPGGTDLTGSVANAYWPDNAAGGDTSSTMDDDGRHSYHISILSGQLHGLSLQAMLDSAGADQLQKDLCVYCHGQATPGSDSDHSSGDDADFGSWLQYWDGTADVAPLPAYNYTQDTCAGVDCHNNNITADGTYGWYDIGSTACTMCHVPGGTGTVEPDSGLHTGADPAVSGVRHDDGLTGCTTCHNTLTSQGTHIDGTDNSANATSMGLFSAYAQTADDQGSCSGAGVSGVSCHGGNQGSGDNGTWARMWDAAVSYTTDGTECQGCHGAFGSWTFGAVADSTDGSVEHERNWDGDGNTNEVEPNHGTCGICHNYGSGTGYAFSTDHRDNSIQMNSNASADYNSADWGCDAGVCHGDAATGHKLEDSGFVIALQVGPSASCTDCHGNPATEQVFPTSGGVNGTAYPNREARHLEHVTVIANRNALSATNTSTCIWCHPGGAHSGDQDAAPADLHDGSTTQFMDILGNTDGGTLAASAVQSGANTVGCTNVDCHYETDLPDSQWYGAGGLGCASCHTDTGTYAAGALPNAHDIHVDEMPDSGYDIPCNACHPIPTLVNHLNGIVEVNFPALAITDGDEVVAGSGGGVKFGFGTSADYYTCQNIYCHGDFDDASPSLGGGNTANEPNWGVSSDGDCGTCHGDTGGATESLKAVPVTGSSGTIHPNHLSMPTSPTVTCTVCHFDWGSGANGTGTNGTYGNYDKHADGTLQAIDINSRFESPSALITDYEGSAPATSGGYGNYTCLNVRCHNGVTTPVWSDASIPGFSCGDCHQDAAGNSPLPTWDTGVSGSHSVHANTDSDFTDCDNCHGVVDGVYTATGGTNHQNLVVELESLPDFGATPAAYSDATPGGVNWIPSVGQDDGICSNISCHGGGTPEWGNPASVSCGSCHTDGQLPPTSGAHSQHLSAVSGSNTDYSECRACHGDYSGTHANGTADVANASVSYNTTTQDCTTSSCHSPTGNPANWGDAGQPWDTTASGSSFDCNECHYWALVPASADNGATAGTISELSHDGHFDASGRTFVCVDCHAAATNANHIDNYDAVADSDDAVLIDRANAEQNEATLDTSAWLAAGTFTDPDPGNPTCTNLCHDPSGDAYAGSGTWGNTNAGCVMCHSNSNPGTGSHDEHLNAQPTYGLIANCSDCHVSNSGNPDHMDGAVELAMATTVTYTGNLNAPYGSPYGTCTTSTCHNDGTGSAVETSAWGTTITDPNCTICHENPPISGQHAVHVANTYVQGTPKCEACHPNNFPGSHLDTNLDMGGTSSVVYSQTDDNCTNDCHLAGDTDEWTSGSLNCTDCHLSGGYVASGYLPASGVHTSSYAATVEAHDDSFDGASASCTSCHNEPPTTIHVDGTFDTPAGG